MSYAIARAVSGHTHLHRLVSTCMVGKCGLTVQVSVSACRLMMCEVMAITEFIQHAVWMETIKMHPHFM